MAVKKDKLRKLSKDKITKAKSEVKNEFILNVPNSLTLLRLLLTFAIAYFILFDYSYIFIGIIFIIAALTDWLDGFFARKLNQKSELGARLDQVIDRVFMIPLVILLIFKVYNIDQGLAFLLIISLSREIIGTPGLIIRLIRNSDAYKVKYIGKVVTFVQSIAVTLIIFGIAIPIFAHFAFYFAIITGLLGIVAGFDYLKDSFI
jgi:CDP-diacylglycerol--glycerol-3-phosphate 3-phosphatidyltransferase